MSRETIHELSQPLMAIATNADHLALLGSALPALRRSLDDGTPLDDESRRRVMTLIDELPVLAADLQEAARVLESLLKELRAGSDDDVSPSS